MNVEYHKWFSQNLNQDMELKVYGHAGKPMLVFPAQSGRFYDFENFGMVGAVHDEARALGYGAELADHQPVADELEGAAEGGRPRCGA